MPLIERLARLLHEPDEISDEVARYARKVTLGWTLFLFGLAMLNLTLALLANPDGILLMMGMHPIVTVPQEVWSLFANFLNYVMAGAFFVIEYIYRQRRFPEQPYKNFIDFMQRARRVGHKSWTSGRTSHERTASSLVRRACGSSVPAGPFPGTPVVPGVVVLDHVLKAGEQWQQRARSCARAEAGEVSFAAAAR